MKTKRDRLWLVEHWQGDGLRQRAVVTTLKGVWSIAKVWLDTTEPSLDYRALTRAVAKGPAEIWCRRRWSSEDEARWNPIGEIVVVSLVPLIKQL